MKTKIPQKLRKGDLIGIVSPSGAYSDDLKNQLETGIKVLEKYGFKVIFGKNALNKHISIQEKVEDFHQMFKNPEIKAIITTQGGQNSNTILDYLNFDLIKNNPKIFIGISDITVLLNAIYKKTKLMTFHGNDILFGFGREYSKYSEEEFYKRLVEGQIGKINKNTSWKCIRKGVSEGILIGGNLGCINKLAGTQYYPDFDNKIIFIEDFDLSTPPEKVECFLYQLKQNGVFEKIKGIWVGNYNHPGGKKYEDMVLEATKEYNFPILKSSDFGHNTENTTIPVGGKIRLDATNEEIIILEGCVK